MPQVKVFNERKAKEVLKGCPKIVRDYVKLLEEALKNQQELTGKAIGRLRETLKTHEKDSSNFLVPCSPEDPCMLCRYSKMT